jgi:Ser/Thr protein kinase RdoA (MazF antagonist)
LPVPSGRPTPNGRSFVAVSIAEGAEHRYAGVLRWTPGDLLSVKLATPEFAVCAPDAFEQLGVLMARLHDHAARWTPPNGFNRGHLDANALLGETPHWGRFWDCPNWSAVERSLVMVARDALRVELDGLGRDRTRYGMIHADLHQDNLIVSGNRLTPIDFDDAAFGWFSFDLATTLQSLRVRTDYALIRERLLSGYMSVRPLDTGGRKLIESFQLVRALSIVGWYMERPEAAAADAAELAALRVRVLGDCTAFLGSRA